MTVKRKRLDLLLIERGFAADPEAAQRLVMAGRVYINEQLHDKAGALIPADAELRVTELREYVGRGAYKLKAALDDFKVDVTGKVCADVGSSTGGFTQVLLERGAKRVYAIDVGYNELDWKLRKDPRVVVMERTNARHLDSLPENIDFASVDVSFISLKLILPKVKNWMAAENVILALIKPQFEAKIEDVGAGGVITDSVVHLEIVNEISAWAADHGFTVEGTKPSQLQGAEGNQEFFIKLS